MMSISHTFNITHPSLCYQKRACPSWHQQEILLKRNPDLCFIEKMNSKRPVETIDAKSKKIKMELKTQDKKSFKSTSELLEETKEKPFVVSKDFAIPLIVKNVYRKDHEIVLESQQGSPGSQRNQVRGPPSTIAYGLNVVSKPKPEKESDEPKHDIEMEDHSQPEMSIEEQALQSLIKGELPILAQNTIPGMENLSSEKDKFMHDLSHRPNEMHLEDYDRVPIESFGTALLKGMGWKEGTAIGKNPNGLLAPIVLTPRASLLGLGATPAPELMDSSKNNRHKKILPGDKIPETKKEKSISRDDYVPRSSNVTITKAEILRGSRVIITGGSQKGSKGAATEIYAKSNGTVVKVKLDATGEIKGVWDDQVKLDHDDSISSSKSSWLRPFISVRIVSKSFRDGEYYNHKCVVQDVTTRGQCIVKTSKGVLLDQVMERYLETVIPSIGKSVMILQNKKDPSLIGQIATLMECYDTKQLATVRFDSTFDIEVFNRYLLITLLLDFSL